MKVYCIMYCYFDDNAKHKMLDSIYKHKEDAQHRCNYLNNLYVDMYCFYIEEYVVFEQRIEE